MKANYNHISPVGQLDAMSCWAACLKFWYKAALSIGKKQSKLIAKYNYLTDEYGGMSNDAMIDIISDTPMYVETYQPANTYTTDVLLQGLASGPVYIAFTEASSHKRHVNVIHGLVGTGAGARVNVMEPQVLENPVTLNWSGAHQVKFLSEFNTTGEIIIGVK